LGPAHLLCRIGAAAAVDQSFERRADAIEECRLAFIYPSHIQAKRLRQRDKEIDKDAGSEHAAQDIDPGHRGLLINLSQPCTSPMLRATKSTISAMYRMSMFARP